MNMYRPLRTTMVAAILLALVPIVRAQDAGDPPERVARLAYQSGDVEFAAAGDDAWGMAEVNRPLMSGDRIGNGDDARAVIELGTASVSLDRDSAFNVLDLDDRLAQFQLSEGALNLRVRRLGADETYEVDTPTVAFVANEAGSYRIDADPDGGSTITVFAGSGIVYGEGGVSQSLAAGRSYRIDDPGLQSITMHVLPRADDFDRFCAMRESHYERSISRRYVPAGMIGGDDLDDYGDWATTGSYGAVWYPRHVAAGWAPYHDGHWAWVDPWGWTWVDRSPWGFAPFHYGRWAYVEGRWGWIPGPVASRPVYAPALVAFIGGGLSIRVGGGEPVGWFPLGPRDVYMPPYRVSQNYFTKVNVTNVKVVNTTVINNVYVNYAANRGPAVTYANRDVPGAVTVVPRTVFTGARPVAAAAIAVKPEAMSRMTVAPVLRIAPVAASVGVAAVAHPAAARMAQFARPVIARHAPPAPPAPFAERARAVAGNGGAPLAPAQLRQISEQHAVAKPAATHVVIATPGGGKVPAPARRPVVAGSPSGEAVGRDNAQRPAREPGDLRAKVPVSPLASPARTIDAASRANEASAPPPHAPPGPHDRTMVRGEPGRPPAEKADASRVPNAAASPEAAMSARPPVRPTHAEPAPEASVRHPQAEAASPVRLPARAEPRQQAEPRPQVEPRSQLAPRPQAEPRPEIAPRPQAEPRPQLAPRPQAEPRPQAQSYPQVQPRPQAELHPRAMPLPPASQPQQAVPRPQLEQRRNPEPSNAALPPARKPAPVKDGKPGSNAESGAADSRKQDRQQ